jgi:formamidopyrimidine-DNA glycosylase
MPELPEVETVVCELNQKLKGKIVAKVEVRLSKVVALGPGTLSPKRTSSRNVAEAFARKLAGQKIFSVERRAKLLIFRFYRQQNVRNPTPSPSSERVAEGRVRLGTRIPEGLSLLVHLKMTGQFIYLKKSELSKKIKIINQPDAKEFPMPGPYTHVIFTFRDGSKLFYNDLRQFGYLKLFTDKELPFVKELAEFGPEPLDKKFTIKVFEKILGRRPKAKIKQLLIDQMLIAGIGNIYSDEILFHAGVRPDRRVSSIQYQVSRKIFEQIKKVLRKGIAARGSSVGDFIRTDGSWGQMGKYHFVYGRAGEKCKVCGTTIKSMKFGGRTSAFCPKCQS